MFDTVYCGRKFKLNSNMFCHNNINDKLAQARQKDENFSRFVDSCIKELDD